MLFTPGLKHMDREADHSSPSNVEIKNTWSSISFMLWSLGTEQLQTASYVYQQQQQQQQSYTTVRNCVVVELVVWT
jgi:hypothetical protein